MLHIFIEGEVKHLLRALQFFFFSGHAREKRDDLTLLFHFQADEACFLVILLMA